MMTCSSEAVDGDSRRCEAANDALRESDVIDADYGS